MIFAPACQLKAAKTEDSVRLHQFINSNKVHTWSLETVAAELGLPSSKTWIFEEKGFIQGYITSRQSGSDHEIISVAVAISARRKGLGRQILSGFMNFLPEGSHVFLEVSQANVAAVKLYSSLGFEVISQRPKYYPDGTTALIMKLNIANPQSF